MKAILIILILILGSGVAFLLFRRNQASIRAIPSETEVIGSDYNIDQLPQMAMVPDNIEELIQRDDSDWKEILSPSAYKVLRQGGTELPYSSELDKENRPGTYVTADCGIPVFRSEQKFDSGTGWPSFWAPISDTAVELKTDNSLGLTRTEVVDSTCDSHLGHIFNDAPQTPTGLRYCLNGVALKFIPDEA